MSFFNTAAQGQQHYGCVCGGGIFTLKLFKSLTRQDGMERFEKESELIQLDKMKTNQTTSSAF